MRRCDDPFTATIHPIPTEPILGRLGSLLLAASGIGWLLGL